MRIKLISPFTKTGLLGKSKKFNFLSNRYGGVPLALPTLAALTPTDIDVCLVDENFAPLNFEEKVDLVGITFNVSGAPRAYQIADEYRRRGVTVVVGGVYASMVQEEAGQHADALVVGEAENVWGGLLRDFQKKNLQALYHGKEPVDLHHCSIPRWDLLKTQDYNYFSVQTTRGCPYDCDYCSVTYLFGGTYRYKPVENVLKELALLKKIDKNKLVFFVDDNISSNRRYALELFNALIPLKMRWFSQSPITIAQDNEMLGLMHKSGCRELFIGFESLSQGSLESMGKGRVNKVEDYEKNIATIYSHGISIFSSFMLGGEHDDEATFEKTERFIGKNNLAFSLINVLVPPPGTRLFKKLESENRILHRDWGLYTGEYVTFRPKRMTPEMLQNGFRQVLHSIYSYENLSLRLGQWWNIISQGRNKGLSLKKLALKVYFSVIIFFSLHDQERKKYLFRMFWSAHTIPISIIALSIHCHDYAEAVENGSV